MAIRSGIVRWVRTMDMYSEPEEMLSVIAWIGHILVYIASLSHRYSIPFRSMTQVGVRGRMLHFEYQCITIVHWMSKCIIIKNDWLAVTSRAQLLPKHVIIMYTHASHIILLTNLWVGCGITYLHPHRGINSHIPISGITTKLLECPPFMRSWKILYPSTIKIIYSYYIYIYI